MVRNSMQLVCTLLALLVQFTHSQEITATATQNGIVSAQGGPHATQSVSYSIMGGDMLDPTSIPTPVDGQPSIISATPSKSSSQNSGFGSAGQDYGTQEQTLSIGAIIGIVVAAVALVVGIILAIVIVHRRRKASIARAKRKIIMDKEFGASKSHLQQFHTEMASAEPPSSSQGNIGYFDIAKPLPVVIASEQPPTPPTPKAKDDDCLSRSSTIIADAAEVAQINRKASTHQARGKKSREAQRERNQALQILITSEDNKTTPWPHSPLGSNPSTPIDAAEDPNGSCPDGNGDSFAKRPSKI